MLNKCLPHFVTSARGWSKLDIHHEILRSHVTTNSIDLCQILIIQMNKNRGIFFSLMSEKKREKKDSTLLHSFTSSEGKNSGIFRFKSEKLSQKRKCSCCSHLFLTSPVTKTRDFSVLASKKST